MVWQMLKVYTFNTVYRIHMHLISGLKELHILEEIGQGAFGRVYKAVWRGTIVAAKEVRTSGNQKILENEMSVYR